MKAASDLAKGYSRAARDYDRVAGPLYLAGIRRLLPLVRVPPFPAILDIGCGTGINLLEAANRFAPTRLLCGLDLAPGMVNVARLKTALRGISAQITQGNAEKLPYAPSTFDLIICNSVLHWLDDRNAAVREMHRVLRPRGQVALICAAEPGFQEWRSFLWTLLQATGMRIVDRPIPRFLTVAEVAALFCEQGFAIEHLQHLTGHQRVSDPVRFVQLMSTVAPYWSGEITPEMQQRIESLAVQCMRKTWPSGFPSTWSAIELIATRR